jgi:hypothetical protein
MLKVNYSPYLQLITFLKSLAVFTKLSFSRFQKTYYKKLTFVNLNVKVKIFKRLLDKNCTDKSLNL